MAIMKALEERQWKIVEVSSEREFKERFTTKEDAEAWVRRNSLHQVKVMSATATWQFDLMMRQYHWYVPAK
jgi:hypothetical protein